MTYFPTSRPFQQLSLDLAPRSTQAWSARVEKKARRRPSVAASFSSSPSRPRPSVDMRRTRRCWCRGRRATAAGVNDDEDDGERLVRDFSPLPHLARI